MYEDHILNIRYAICTNTSVSFGIVGTLKYLHRNMIQRFDLPTKHTGYAKGTVKVAVDIKKKAWFKRQMKRKKTWSQQEWNKTCQESMMTLKTMSTGCNWGLPPRLKKTCRTCWECLTLGVAQSKKTNNWRFVSQKMRLMSASAPEITQDVF